MADENQNPVIAASTKLDTLHLQTPTIQLSPTATKLADGRWNH
jgi:hypothetical protein